MIRVLCNADAPGAFADLYWTETVGRQDNFAGKPKSDYAVYVREFAEGATVAMREANGYDDSDFFATYYDAEKDTFVEVMYGTTRVWTYPANATIDATTEIAAKYEAHLRAQLAAHQAYLAEIEAKRPRKGKRCKITTKRGKAGPFFGQVGEIFWTQEMRSRYGTWSYCTRGGVDINGKRVFVNSTGIVIMMDDEQ